MSSIPRIRFDLSQNVAEMYYLLSVGVQDDLSQLGIELKDGLRVILYDTFCDNGSNPMEFVVEGIVSRLQPWGWVVHPDRPGRQTRSPDST